LSYSQRSNSFSSALTRLLNLATWSIESVSVCLILSTKARSYWDSRSF